MNIIVSDPEVDETTTDLDKYEREPSKSLEVTIISNRITVRQFKMEELRH